MSELFLKLNSQNDYDDADDDEKLFWFGMGWVLRSTEAKREVRLFPLDMGRSDIEKLAYDEDNEVEKENHDGDGYNYYVYWYW